MDKQFVELNDATVVAQVARPGGTTMTVPLQWTGERDGQYRGTFVSTEAGAYEITVDATRAGRTGRRQRRRLRPRRAERGRVLRSDDARARRCGGSPRRPAAGSTRPTPRKGLAEDVRYAGRGVTSVEERELWNMPIILDLAAWDWSARSGAIAAWWGLA